MSEDKLAKIESRSIYNDIGTFETAQRMAKALSASDFVPDRFRGNIPNTLIAIDIALSFGNWRNPPKVLAVMQNLYVVHGKPGFEAKFVIGLVNTCGKFGAMEWEFIGEKGSTNYGAYAVVKELKTGKVLKGSTIDMEMAAKEGWLFKKDKKGNDITTKWQSMPEQMLKYRSASFWVRTHAPELLLGMHTADELEDVEEVVTAEVLGDTRDDLEVIADKLEDNEF